MTLVARFRENQYRHDLAFERLVQFAKDDGDSFRTMDPRLNATRLSTIKSNPLTGILRTPRATSHSTPPNQQVAFMRETPTPARSSHSHSAYESVQEKHDEEAFVVEETDPANSIATSELPSTVHGDASSIQEATNTENGEQLLWLEHNGYSRARDAKRVRPHQSRMKMRGQTESAGSQR